MSNRLKNVISGQILDNVEETIRASRAKHKEEESDSTEKLDTEEESETDEQISVIPSEELIKKDFLVVRKNLKKLIRNGNAAVNQIVEAMKPKENGGEARVLARTQDLSDLIKTLVISNKELMAVHEIKERLLNGEGGKKKDPSINENEELEVTSAGLNKLIDTMIKDKVESEVTIEASVKPKKKKKE